MSGFGGDAKLSSASMTVVAAYRGVKDSLNALVVDTVSPARDKPSEVAFWTDKVSHLYGDTYSTAVGDADIINGARAVVDFLDPKRPNLRDPATIDAILGAVERIWAVRSGQGAQRYGSNGLVFFVCNRSEVFYWVCGYDNETLRFERPKEAHDVKEGTCVVFWGSERFTVRELEKLHGDIKANPFKMIPMLIQGVDAEARALERRGLSYALDGKFSGVALPHKTNIPLTRLRPFSLPEYLVREAGPDCLPMLEDVGFMNYELPPGSLRR